MRILVTGGMGDVGRPTVQWLLDKGHEVRVLDLECEAPINGAECREGSHVLYIYDDHNSMTLPSRELAKVWFPDVTTWKRPVSGTETLVSIDRARELIGFEVMYHYE